MGYRPSRPFLCSRASWLSENLLWRDVLTCEEVLISCSIDKTFCVYTIKDTCPVSPATGPSPLDAAVYQNTERNLNSLSICPSNKGSQAWETEPVFPSFQRMRFLLFHTGFYLWFNITCSVHIQNCFGAVNHFHSITSTDAVWRVSRCLHFSLTFPP